jgi:hypothetical protein
VLRDVFELKRLREAIFPTSNSIFYGINAIQRTPTLSVRVDTHIYQIAAEWLSGLPTIFLIGPIWSFIDPIVILKITCSLTRALNR